MQETGNWLMLICYICKGLGKFSTTQMVSFGLVSEKMYKRLCDFGTVGFSSVEDLALHFIIGFLCDE